MDQPLGSVQLGGLLQLEKYGGLLPDEMWRPKLLEDENVRIKKIVAALTLARLCRTLFGESSEAGTDA